MDDRFLIKAKHMGDRVWIIGYVFPKRPDHSKVFIRTFPDNDDNTLDSVIDPLTLCQCLGWEDSKNVNVFEWDIVEAKTWKHSKMVIMLLWGEWCTATMEEYKKYKKGKLIYPTGIHHHYSSKGCDFEIVGNIHDEDGEKDV